MKKIFNLLVICLLLLFLLLIPLFCIIFQFYLHEKNWNLNFESINKTNIIKILIEENHFKKNVLYNGKEILIDNQLYDIIRTEKCREGNMIILYVLHDKDELFILSFLKNFLSSLIKNNLLILLFLILPIFYLLKISLFYHPVIRNFEENFTLPLIFLSSLSMPPENCFFSY